MCDSVQKKTLLWQSFKFVLTFLMHLCVATIGAMILAGLLTAIALEIPNPWGQPSTMHAVHGILTESPYFPVQLSVGLLLGWLLSELYQNASMLWVWIVPYAAFVYNFARSPSLEVLPFEARLAHFFGSGCRLEAHCLDQIGITLPLYTATAYSIAALVARKLPMRSQVFRRKVSALLLAVGVLIVVDAFVGLIFHLDSLLALAPRGWGWLLWPALIVDLGIGVSTVLLALKLRRAREGEEDLLRVAD